MKSNGGLAVLLFSTFVFGFIAYGVAELLNDDMQRAGHIYMNARKHSQVVDSVDAGGELGSSCSYTADDAG